MDGVTKIIVTIMRCGLNIEVVKHTLIMLGTYFT